MVLIPESAVLIVAAVHQFQCPASQLHFVIGVGRNIVEAGFENQFGLGSRRCPLGGDHYGSMRPLQGGHNGIARGNRGVFNQMGFEFLGAGEAGKGDGLQGLVVIHEFFPRRDALLFISALFISADQLSRNRLNVLELIGYHHPPCRAEVGVHQIPVAGCVFFILVQECFRILVHAFQKTIEHADILQAVCPHGSPEFLLGFRESAVELRQFPLLCIQGVLFAGDTS